MNSVGKLLKEQREKLNKTIEECANETKLSRRYIEAIEEENMDEFPGEAYYLGFLRNYAQSLNLDPDEIILIYKKQKKVEQPIPIEELTKPFIKRKIPTYYIIISSIVAAFILILVLILSLTSNSPSPSGPARDNQANQAAANQNQNQGDNDTPNDYSAFYKFQERKIMKELIVEEGITVINSQGTNIHFLFKSYQTEEKSIIIYCYESNRDYTLNLSDSILIDYNRDEQNDLSLKLDSFSQTSPGIVYITLERLTNIEPSSKQFSGNIIINKASEMNKTIIVDITTNKTGFVKYIIDNDEESQTFISTGDNLRIIGKTSVELHLTHLANLTIKINDKLIDLPSQFTAIIVIKWVYDQNTGTYKYIYEVKE